MHLTRKALLCFIILILTGCNLSTVRKDSTPSATTQHEAAPKVIVETREKTADNQATPLEQSVSASQAHRDVWQQIKNELTFATHADKASVRAKIQWFAKNQAYIDRVSERAQPYLYHIVSRLKARNMPLDLALLPIVESAYQPFAYSPSRASGIWQFIPATGKRYGMKQNWWYDGRRDIIAATEGALDYLEMLHKRFNGNWNHALAAYNAGEGNVERAIRRNKKAGKPIDFWSLRLPRETRGYVPSLLAVAEILKKPNKYPITFNEIPNQPHFEAINVGSQIDLATVARLSDMSIDDVYKLNPGFNQWATDPNGPHRILVPIDKSDSFKQKLAALPKSERIKWTRHTIREGESLGVIARRYNTSVSALKSTNNLRSNLIRAGRSLLIPTSKEATKFYTLSADARKFRGLKTTGDGKRYIYKVKRGDNLWDIGRHYGISVKQLTQWNGISRKSLLKPGQKLTVWVKDDGSNNGGMVKAVAKNKSDASSYTVKRGDSLWLIARKFDIHVKDLLEWNNLKKGRHLQPGQTLIVKQDALTGA